ncbi:LPXTG cell wall anchor domain-containing protein [Candidatus Nomurabacteria bacterium]|nr:LPXTG cell wall anchor domain-containing protein [Candidatus Nomurabacteria bacterium]
MITEKINHFLFKIFIFLLVFTQGIVFVTTRAAYDNTQQLNFQFVLSADHFQVGELVKLQGRNFDVEDFDTFNFVVKDQNKSFELQWQAFLDEDGFWSADSFWDTSSFLAGDYFLSAQASSYDSAGNLVIFKVSPEVKISLSGEIVIAAESKDATTDQNISEETKTEESDDSNKLADLATELLINLSSPSVQENINQDNFPIELSLNRALNADEILGASLYNIEGDLFTNFELTMINNDPVLYGANFGEIKNYPLGEYYLVVWLNQNLNYLNQPLIFEITENKIDENQHLSEEEILNLESNPENYQISLLSPQDNSFVSHPELSFEFRSNFIANDFGFLLVKEDDASIGDEYSISKFDGLHWNKSVVLDQDFIDGVYILAAIATDSSGVVYEEDFVLNLALQSEENLSLASPAIESEDDQDNESEQSQAAVVDEKDDQEEKPALCQVDADCVNLCSGCYAQSELPVVDCAAIPRGSCSCVVGKCQKQEEGLEQIKKEENLGGADLDQICLDEGIDEVNSCEDYLNRTVVDLKCQEQQLFDRQACHNYLLETYASDVTCASGDTNSCQKILAEEYLNRLVVRKLEQEKLNQDLVPFLGKTTKIGELNEALFGAKNLSLDPVLAKEQSVLVFNSQKATVLSKESVLEDVPAAVLMLDSDQDGLPDDLEKYFATDPLNQDSDADGYSDLVEIKNSYNPNGSGQLEEKFSNFAELVLAGASLEQAKIKRAAIESAWQIKTEFKDDQSLELSGTVDPDVWLTIYIYSDLPLVLSTKSDQSGAWSYSLNSALAEGEHEIYLAVNDQDGKILKQSNPRSLLVKESMKTDSNNYLKQLLPKTDQGNGNLFYYILGAFLAVLVSSGLIFFIKRHRAGE